VNFQACEIHHNLAYWPGGGVGGGMLIWGGQVTITGTKIYSNQASSGGGLIARFVNALSMVDTNIYSNQASSVSGGLLVERGVTTMSTTLLWNNTAPIGANINVTAGLLYYARPTPPGYWLPTTDCVANRKPCSQCKSVSCSTTSGTAENNWTPHPCMAPLAIQPCDWKTDACAEQNADKCLLGKKIYIVPYRPVDVTFPYPCAAGYLGSNETSHQISSDCAGKCPGGFYCPMAVTLTAMPCDRGSYCPEGSSVPLPCAKGTYSNVTNLESREDCVICPPGTFCSVGSIEPTACAPGSYNHEYEQETCLSCNVGTFASDSNNTACRNSTAGYPSPAQPPLPPPSIAIFLSSLITILLLGVCGLAVLRWRFKRRMLKAPTGNERSPQTNLFRDGAVMVYADSKAA